MDPLPEITEPLRVICFGAVDVALADPEIIAGIDEADLVIALGDINLHALAAAIGPTKPALCVLGDNDVRARPPAPFRPLHGDGVVFKGWRFLGLSGGPDRNDDCFHLEESEALKRLGEADSCDVLITHMPPQDLDAIADQPASQAIRTYLDHVPPIYHFYANQREQNLVIAPEGTLCIGVHGAMVLPPLEP